MLGERTALAQATPNMPELARFFAHNELLLLFVTVLCGILLGRVEVRGVKLGVAGVLFAGLGLSAFLKPPDGQSLTLAPQLKEFGLVLFVYTVGLTSAPGFFSAFKSKGLQLNLAVATTLAVAAGACLLLGRFWGLASGSIAGVFAGALTNTPALAAATDRLSGTPDALLPVIAYSLTYPFGVLGALFSFRILVKSQKNAFNAELERTKTAHVGDIASQSCRVVNAEIVGRALGELRIRDRMGVVVSRVRRGNEVMVPTKYTRFEVGDVVTIVGSRAALDAAVVYFGEVSDVRLESDRDRVDMRRILVSRRDLVGRSIRELNLAEKFNAQVTRLRRADIDIVPSGELRIELGDRLRVVAPRENLPQLAAYFGDSERELAAVDFVALGAGLTLGLLLARIPLPLFGSELRLGIAGGPLVAALILGRIGRTGPLAWSMPFEINTTLRELGLLLFLAGVGVTAGGQLTQWMNPSGLVLFGLGCVVTILTSALGLLLFRMWCGAGLITSLGAASGLQTQPATLAAAYEISGKSEQVYVAYALTYPIAMIGKILLVQLLASAG